MYHLLIPIVIVLQFLATPDPASSTTVGLGASLNAIDDNSSWTSPSGDFAFGFRPYPGRAGYYVLAIWFANIPEKTVVWSANSDFAVPKESKVELTSMGGLELTGPGGWMIWSSQIGNAQASQGAMQDTGNFVIMGTDSSTVWESFRNPTNTILPTQVVNVGDVLASTLSENNITKGKFELRLLPGQLVLNQLDSQTRFLYDAYFAIQNVTQLIFNSSGYIFANQSSNGTIQLTPSSFAGNSQSYYRATLDFDGTFTQYMRPRTSNGNEAWSIISVTPPNICLAIRALLGSGPCGYNSYCELNPYGKPNCGCPPGFSLLDLNNQYSGCKQNYLQQCTQDGSNVQEIFDFITMDGVDWPLADYELLSPSSEYDCTMSCQSDCYCSVAIFQDPKYNNGVGNCWKKKLPLSNGRLNRSAVDRRALFKVLTSNSSAQPAPNRNQDPKILLLSVLLGTSGILNFFSIAAICFLVCFVCQRRLYQIAQVSDGNSHPETNLRSYSYKELEKATNNFKEELGRGAFGTVYKGMLHSGSGKYIAVKKLDKIVEEGEKEFTSEVNAIGQTHHKNLVLLLGYCSEANHRLLVYDFMQNGSLDSYLFASLQLSWQQRVQIASGIARGLMYLHEECSKQIIHCDIKPQNILLDDSFTAKISDFGLAKLLIQDQTRTLTGVRGTRGYVAPEWFRHTPISTRVDVYSFGVVLLEIICCRKSVDPGMENAEILTEWAYDCYAAKKVSKLVKDNDTEARSDMKRLDKFVMVAMWCLQEEPSLRPSMRTVTLMLEGILEVPAPPCPFSYSYSSISSSFGIETNTKVEEMHDSEKIDKPLLQY